jgi:hypothetical protein
VFEGCRELFARNAVAFVFCEMIFADLYVGTPSFGRLFDFLVGSGFALVSFYDIAYSDGLAAWTDALFVNKAHHQKALAASAVATAKG